MFTLLLMSNYLCQFLSCFGLKVTAPDLVLLGPAPVQLQVLIALQVGQDTTVPDPHPVPQAAVSDSSVPVFGKFRRSWLNLCSVPATHVWFSSTPKHTATPPDTGPGLLHVNDSDTDPAPDPVRWWVISGSMSMSQFSYPTSCTHVQMLWALPCCPRNLLPGTCQGLSTHAVHLRQLATQWSSFC